MKHNHSTSPIGSAEELTAQLAVEILVPDISSAVEFYQKIGFIVERNTGGFVSLRWGESYLFLAEKKGISANPREVNIRIIVPDVNEVWNKVTKFGLFVVNAMGDRAYGLRDFVVRDPAGFEVRFASVLSRGD